MRPDIVPGAMFPDYKLADRRGHHRTLSELQAECRALPLYSVFCLRGCRAGLSFSGS